MDTRYFVIQVVTGTEPRVVALTEERFALHQIDVDVTRLWWPRRRLMIRRKGVRVPSLAPIFPGYLILETTFLSAELIGVFRGVTGFVRFLRSTQSPEPVGARDAEVLRSLLGHGEIIGPSKVTFDENNRIVVREGPLQGMEGRIIKVDRRRGRARVRLDMYEESFQIDFGFELLAKAPEPSASAS